MHSATTCFFCCIAVVFLWRIVSRYPDQYGPFPVETADDTIPFVAGVLAVVALLDIFIHCGGIHMLYRTFCWVLYILEGILMGALYKRGEGRVVLRKNTLRGSECIEGEGDPILVFFLPYDWQFHSMPNIEHSCHHIGAL